MEIVKQSHNIRYRQKPKDNYYTPEDLAKKLIARVSLNPGDSVIDNAAGKGAFFNNYPNFVKKAYFEIDEGTDFLGYPLGGFIGVDWIITNPPYSNLNTWLKKTCLICRKGFAYLLAVHAITPRRIEMIESMGFGLTQIHLVKVMQWFGLSAFCVFEKGKKSIVNYDTIIYQSKKEE